MKQKKEHQEFSGSLLKSNEDVRHSISLLFPLPVTISHLKASQAVLLHMQMHPLLSKFLDVADMQFREQFNQKGM